MTRTCEQMLLDRGCTAVRVADAPLCEAAAGRPFVRGEAPDTEVYLHLEDRVGVRFARQVVEGLGEGKKSALIVSLEGPTPFTRRECEGQRLQFFTCRQLCVNVTRHSLVPRHTAVAPAGHDLALLPKLLETDAVAQYYGWPVGTVVQIERRLGTHEPIPYFRVVSASS